MESTSTKEIITIKNLLKEQVGETVSDKLQECRYLYLVFTDRILFAENTEENMQMDSAKLLECRIFDESYELRGKRMSLAGKWFWREKDEREQILTEDQYYDMSCYLDIDATKVHGNTYCPTGGKKEYTLPVPIELETIRGSGDKKSKIAKNQLKIRNYISYYEETGQAYVADWRLMGFVTEEVK